MGVGVDDIDQAARKKREHHILGKVADVYGDYREYQRRKSMHFRPVFHLDERGLGVQK